jgi:CheY-like chemotaxis protein
MTEPVDVLLVEDQAHDAELALRAFNQLNLGKNVSVVRDGAAALDFIFGRGAYEGRSVDDLPTLILLDLKLPKVSGLEVLSTLKSDDRTRHIPIIALTSSREGCDVTECYDLGVNSYVVKPVDFEAFTEAIQEIATYWLTINEEPC